MKPSKFDFDMEQFVVAPKFTTTENISSEDEPQMSKLTCPYCGFDYVHIGRISVEQGKTLVDVTNENVSVSAIDRSDSAARGSLVVLRFVCEGGHAFQYEMHFSKGNVFFSASAAGSDNDDVDVEIDWNSKELLWRD